MLHGPAWLLLSYVLHALFAAPVFQTAVSLAYGLGPLIGGYLVEIVGFPNIMRTVGVMNIVYMPLLFLLKVCKDKQTDILYHSVYNGV